MFIALNLKEIIVYCIFWGLAAYCSVYLFLPKRICYKLIKLDKKHKEKIENFKSLGTEKYTIEPNYERSYIISKIFSAVFVLIALTYLVVKLLLL